MADTGRESDKFMLRLPDGMRDRIKAVAAQNNRSMNAEIVATLEAKYPSHSVSLVARAVETKYDEIRDRQGEKAAADYLRKVVSGVVDVP